MGKNILIAFIVRVGFLMFPDFLFWFGYSSQAYVVSARPSLESLQNSVWETHKKLKTKQQQQQKQTNQPKNRKNTHTLKSL